MAQRRRSSSTPFAGASAQTANPSVLAGAAAHYEDPTYYCRTYKTRLADVVFYTERAARARRVLELGCGNGRITLPIARSGVDIVGVDLSEAMVHDLATRLEEEPPEVQARVEFRVADMRRFVAPGQFDLVICPFNAFLHLYSRKDVENFLACVRRALSPRGALAFDVSIPDPAELARKPERLYRTRPFVYPGVGKVRYGERFDYDALAQVLHVSMEFEPERGEAFTTPLTHRQFHPQELEALLHYNRFRIVELLGDFEGPPNESTQSLVIVAKPRR